MKPPEDQRKLTPQEYGKIGSLRRWGVPRVIRLDALKPAQRQVVIDLVETLKGGK